MNQDHPHDHLGDTERDTSVDTPPSGSTTHDLRQQALEAIRMLREASATKTLSVESQAQASSSASVSAEAPQMLLGAPQEVDEPTALFSPGDVLCLTLDEGGECLSFSLSETSLVIGRVDTQSDYRPHIDLSNYGAYRLGLSRKHAQVMRQGKNVWLVDLGGRNGTYLNEHRLQPNRPHVLRDGDQVMLGNLKLRVNFWRSG
ncbi:MAG: FHA domain-containing protein [Anaerolineae bacterium]|nr:FHA domain-containing protein [Anaerolineae bacterium]MDW8173544.1 FHA domain-containing protein [Anaerolineae bacterium]